MMMMILQPNLTVIPFHNINEMKYELKKVPSHNRTMYQLVATLYYI